MKMSTTWLWGEPESQLKSNMLRVDPSMNGCKDFGGLGGNRWPEGSELRVSIKIAIVSQ